LDSPICKLELEHHIACALKGSGIEELTTHYIILVDQIGAAKRLKSRRSIRNAFGALRSVLSSHVEFAVSTTANLKLKLLVS
jgi:hypothetical protein